MAVRGGGGKSKVARRSGPSGRSGRSGSRSGVRKTSGRRGGSAGAAAAAAAIASGDTSSEGTDGEEDAHAAAAAQVLAEVRLFMQDWGADGAESGRAEDVLAFVRGLRAGYAAARHGGAFVPTGSGRRR